MKTTFLSLAMVMLGALTALGQDPYDELPFSTDANHITVWNGDSYVPLFIKGMNLGISKPGTQPGELAASKKDYARWLTLIQEAGFNAIRLYTLHYPRFYHVLDSFNNAHPNKPIYFFQGIWIEEEIEGYANDLYSLSPSFQNELAENIGAVHGDVSIDPRFGKAYGDYDDDVSKYLIGYIVGREIHPPEVATTNTTHSTDSEYSGTYLSISGVSASEVWMTGLLDDVLSFEQENYGMMHPISFSSWPTLDPLVHPGESNSYEDSETIDLKNLNLTNAPGGYFASYHAYPYYPDFISKQASYQDGADYIGQNSYLAYVKDLKAHYANFPLLIAEFGTSSSWGIAHYAQNGIHHGGASEIEQGEAYLRMFWNFEEAELAGGVQFAWIDEWFKRTWITDPFDNNADRRVLWQNVSAAEQNFGLLGYRKPGEILESWESVCSPCQIESIDAGADYSFFRLRLNMSEEFNVSDSLWVGLDTYDDALGESFFPDGKNAARRNEFALLITQDQADLYVTEAYDTYGIWHGTSGENQIYQSTQTDGAPWKLVRWKNNNTQNEIQFVGRLGVNRLNMPLQSNDAVIISKDNIEIRIPWTLIHFVDPSEKKVLHDDRLTAPRENLLSEGIGVEFIYQDQSFSSATRYSWTDWQFPSDVEEYTKQSYDIIKQGLESIPSDPIAHADYYDFGLDEGNVSKNEGVLSNDISFGTTAAEAYLREAPQNGLLQLNVDGSFSYQPISGFSGVDEFTYRLRVGSNWSEAVTVTLNIDAPLSVRELKVDLALYPNPGSDVIQFRSKEKIRRVEVYNASGGLTISHSNDGIESVKIGHLQAGLYFVNVHFKNHQSIHKFVKQ